jgi:8-oxo-dGTP pyrophosphatase MutT (NUDIX family)
MPEESKYKREGKRSAAVSVIEAGWETIESSVALDSKWFRVILEKVRLPGGSKALDYFLWDKGDAALVVPILSDGSFLVTRQYKHGVKGPVVEFPGGALEPGEPPLGGAQRELLEETGYKSTSLTPLLTLVNDPTKERGLLHVYIAEDVVQIEDATPEVTESIETYVVSPDELRKLVDEGEMRTSSSVSAALLALQR